MANSIVVVESIVSLILTALATGLVFAKFSRSTARMVFTHQAVIYPYNGVPTISIRVGNQRSNQIVNAEVRLTLSRTETTSEGKTFYRIHDLKLARDRISSLSRSWTLLHVIDEHSPLYNTSPEMFVRQECELHLMVVGMDDTSLQPIHASKTYFTHEVLWGASHKDVLTEQPDGNLLLDPHRFHETEPTEATTAFPYSHR